MNGSDTREMPVIGLAGSNAMQLDEAELRRTLDEMGHRHLIETILFVLKVRPDMGVLVNAKQLKLAQQN